MKDKLSHLPLPITGLMLGTFALGNLLQSHHPLIRMGCGIIGIGIFILITLRILLNWDQLQRERKQVLMASVFPTYSMSTMLLATYLKPYLGMDAR
ncbi:MAG: hypothetical protein Q4A55_01620 [Aerococcus sp.]|nr:hypothetical protein [Aerococcus sp.]